MADFIVQQQEKTQWCWAAVAVSLKGYVAPGGAPSQCQLATEILKVSAGCCNPATVSPDPCDQQSGLIAALTLLQVLKPNANLISGPLTFPEVQQVINAGWPIPVRIVWNGNPGNAHFVVISGFRASAAPQLRIEDPHYGTSVIDYRKFLTAYQSDGRWSQTYPIWGGN